MVAILFQVGYQSCLLDLLTTNINYYMRGSGIIFRALPWKGEGNLGFNSISYHGFAHPD